MAITPPPQGFIFWPVGTGDSTTVRVAENVYVQIDLRHMAKSEDDEGAAWPVIDELIKILPKFKCGPYLSVFALTHPDQDHCQGFENLSNDVFISELWMSPRTFHEIRKREKLCDDAKAFHDEAKRRVKATIAAGGDPGHGDRIRIIGYDDLLKEPEFRDFPQEFLSVPGQAITTLDGKDLSGTFEAFVHAPFKDDSFGDRNDCSVAFQITLRNGDGVGKALLLGDLSYPVIERIFSNSDEDSLEWNLLLAPHHCSKSAMYWKDDGEEEETLRSQIVTDIHKAALDPSYIVSSSEPIPTSNEPGDNPPHAKAKGQYQSIVCNNFLCTHEHPNRRKPVPIVFEVTTDGFAYVGERQPTKPLSDTVKEASGRAARPVTGTGFGREIK